MHLGSDLRVVADVTSGNSSSEFGWVVIFLLRAEHEYDSKQGRVFFSLTICIPKSAIQRKGLEFAPPSRIKVSNAILDMYARCGSVDDARAVFDRMASRTNISWTSMVAAYAQNGHPSLALEISREMDQVGMSKNAITFITILSACNHGGLLEEGIRFLAGMRRDHGVLPRNAHYSCVIDLLGKAGRLEEAESMIAGLVERPDAGLWRSLLGSCRIHGDEVRAGRAGEELKKLEPSDAAPYVVKKLFRLET
ncbi:pentatricopeptide repeat-containing protein At4g02750-like [Selaginella moellendorffii]|uniref:pentatricopeptide repeat-containing protein At4g02750-like n=1 Tax=Selaginella moellendorffii TaxID=88036 RepID=UPI000D1CCDBF|nr:pentatricopeptide repeat-containing protein At4g02750-like [Selaginella moellendorffii]|eukprot:XP_024532923.1 pentatricopeptide repeat-containing protein At4g02750-like [Selaginella moellendorffii]